MAAPLMLRVNSLAKTSLLAPCGISSVLGHQDIRQASKKLGKQTNNKKKRTPGKGYGWKRWEGDYVEKGTPLYKQLGLKVYPGENVGCSHNLTLYALEAGRVVVTHEKLSPYPDSPLYPAVKAGKDIYKMFFHVIMEEQEKRFKLVSQV